MSSEYNIDYTPIAKDELKEIIRYLSQFYPSTPVKFKKEMNKCLSVLESNPYLYKVYLNNPEYRQAPVSSYVVFYKISEENPKTVKIYRILHSARNIERILYEYGEEI